MADGKDELADIIRAEIEANGHATVTWHSFALHGGLSEAEAKEWAAGFCSRPGRMALTGTVLSAGISFWPATPPATKEE